MKVSSTKVTIYDEAGVIVDPHVKNGFTLFDISMLRMMRSSFISGLEGFAHIYARDSNLKNALGLEHKMCL